MQETYDDVDICVTCVSPRPPQLPLREELPSLGVEVVYKARGAGARAAREETQKALDNFREREHEKSKSGCFPLIPTSPGKKRRKREKRERIERELSRLKSLSYDEYLGYLRRDGRVSSPTPNYSLPEDVHNAFESNIPIVYEEDSRLPKDERVSASTSNYSVPKVVHDTYEPKIDTHSQEESKTEEQSYWPEDPQVDTIMVDDNVKSEALAAANSVFADTDDRLTAEALLLVNSVIAENENLESLQRDGIDDEVLIEDQYHGIVRNATYSEAEQEVVARLPNDYEKEQALNYAFAVFETAPSVVADDPKSQSLSFDYSSSWPDESSEAHNSMQIKGAGGNAQQHQDASAAIPTPPLTAFNNEVMDTGFSTAISSDSSTIDSFSKTEQNGNVATENDFREDTMEGKENETGMDTDSLEGQGWVASALAKISSGIYGSQATEKVKSKESGSSENTPGVDKISLWKQEKAARDELLSLLSQDTPDPREVQMMVRANADIVQRGTNTEGRLPFHVACDKVLPHRKLSESSSNSASLIRDLTMDITNHLELLEVLSSENINACMIPDASGDLPVHLLARRLIKWEENWEHELSNTIAASGDASGVAEIDHATTACVEIALKPIMSTRCLCRARGSTGRILPLHVASWFKASSRSFRHLLESYPESAAVPCDFDCLVSPEINFCLPLELFERPRNVHVSFLPPMEPSEEELLGETRVQQTPSRSGEYDLRSDLIFSFHPNILPFRRDEARIERMVSLVIGDAQHLVDESGNAELNASAKNVWLWFCTFDDGIDPQDNYVAAVDEIVNSLEGSVLKELAMVKTEDGRILLDAAIPECADIIKARIGLGASQKKEHLSMSQSRSPNLVLQGYQYDDESVPTSEPISTESSEDPTSSIVEELNSSSFESKSFEESSVTPISDSEQQYQKNEENTRTIEGVEGGTAHSYEPQASPEKLTASDSVEFEYSLESQSNDSQERNEPVPQPGHFQDMVPHSDQEEATNHTNRSENDTSSEKNSIAVSEEGSDPNNSTHNMPPRALRDTRKQKPSMSLQSMETKETRRNASPETVEKVDAGVLCKTIFNVKEESFPTSFVIMPYKLKKGPGGTLTLESPEYANVAMKFAQCLLRATAPWNIFHVLEKKSVEHLGHKISPSHVVVWQGRDEKNADLELVLLSLYTNKGYLYFLDEANGVPMVEPISPKQDEYPIEIIDAVDAVQRLLPLMLMGMVRMRGEKAMAVLAKTILQGFDYDAPPGWILAANDIINYMHFQERKCDESLGSTASELASLSEELGEYMSKVTSGDTLRRPESKTGCEWIVELSFMKTLLEGVGSHRSYAGLRPLKNKRRTVLWTCETDEESSENSSAEHEEDSSTSGDSDSTTVPNDHVASLDDHVESFVPFDKDSDILSAGALGKLPAVIEEANEDDSGGSTQADSSGYPAGTRGTDTDGLTSNADTSSSRATIVLENNGDLKESLFAAVKEEFPVGVTSSRSESSSHATQSTSFGTEDGKKKNVSLAHFLESNASNLEARRQLEREKLALKTRSGPPPAWAHDETSPLSDIRPSLSNPTTDEDLPKETSNAGSTDVSGDKLVLSSERPKAPEGTTRTLSSVARNEGMGRELTTAVANLYKSSSQPHEDHGRTDWVEASTSDKPSIGDSVIMSRSSSTSSWQSNKSVKVKDDRDTVILSRSGSADSSTEENKLVDSDRKQKFRESNDGWVVEESSSSEGSGMEVRWSTPEAEPSSREKQNKSIGAVLTKQDSSEESSVSLNAYTDESKKQVLALGRTDEEPFPSEDDSSYDKEKEHTYEEEYNQGWTTDDTTDREESVDMSQPSATAKNTGQQEKLVGSKESMNPGESDGYDDYASDSSTVDTDRSSVKSSSRRPPRIPSRSMEAVQENMGIPKRGQTKGEDSSSSTSTEPVLLTRNPMLDEKWTFSHFDQSRFHSDSSRSGKEADISNQSDRVDPPSKAESSFEWSRKDVQTNESPEGEAGFSENTASSDETNTNPVEEQVSASMSETTPTEPTDTSGSDLAPGSARGYDTADGDHESLVSASKSPTVVHSNILGNEMHVASNLALEQESEEDSSCMNLNDYIERNQDLLSESRTTRAVGPSQTESSSGGAFASTESSSKTPSTPGSSQGWPTENMTLTEGSKSETQTATTDTLGETTNSAPFSPTESSLFTTSTTFGFSSSLSPMCTTESQHQEEKPMGNVTSSRNYASDDTPTTYSMGDSIISEDSMSSTISLVARLCKLEEKILKREVDLQALKLDVHEFEINVTVQSFDEYRDDAYVDPARVEDSSERD